MADAVQSVHYQIMWNRLISVVEEQALALIRTAFSSSVREAGDLSAGVFDAEGRMMAQAVTGTPGHVNAMAAAVSHFITDLGRDTMEEGDVYLTNDPWKGSGHLHDFTFVTPSFRNGKLIGFFACTAHVVDVGGRGFGPDANEVYEEGICIPIMRFASRGDVDMNLINIVRHNVREADQVVGDLYSIAACNDTGHNRLMSMMDEFGMDDLEDIRDFIFTNSRKATVERIAALPQGSYSNCMTVDGYDTPIDIAVEMTVKSDEINVDFTGTSDTSPFGINVPLIYTTAYACYGLKCALAPEIPNNYASLEPFTVSAPEGCILNALHPAPVAVRHVLGHFIPDAVFGAIEKCAPGIVPAEGAGALWNIQISARPNKEDQVWPGDKYRSSEVLIFNCGGAGARPQVDGLHATAFPSGVHGMSVEATEQSGPIVVRRKEFRDGSGGKGRMMGGMGQIIEIEAAAGHLYHFNAMFDRVGNAASGRAGGENGAAGRVRLDDGTVMKTKGRQSVPQGRRLVIELPGGGGYGPYSDREAALAEQDALREYTSDNSD